MAILARALIREFPEYELLLAHLGDQVRQARHAQLQHADRPLSRRRRHEDRLHLRVRLQCGGVGHAQRPAADRGRARRAVPARCARRRPRRLLERGFSDRRLLLADAVARHRRYACSRSLPQPPNLRDEMCGKNRKRPAAESEDSKTKPKQPLPPRQRSEFAAGGDAVEPARRRTPSRRRCCGDSTRRRRADRGVRRRAARARCRSRTAEAPPASRRRKSAPRPPRAPRSAARWHSRAATAARSRRRRRTASPRRRMHRAEPSRRRRQPQPPRREAGRAAAGAEAAPTAAGQAGRKKPDPKPRRPPSRPTQRAGAARRAVTAPTSRAVRRRRSR